MLVESQRQIAAYCCRSNQSGKIRGADIEVALNAVPGQTGLDGAINLGSVDVPALLILIQAQVIPFTLHSSRYHSAVCFVAENEFGSPASVDANIQSAVDLLSGGIPANIILSESCLVYVLNELLEHSDDSVLGEIAN